MYIPPKFAESDKRVLHDLIRDNSFGILITTIADVPVASHLPFLLDGEAGANGTLIAHMARANPHWLAFAADAAESLVVFQGPHTYISPSWYAPGNFVPTWNYTTVHAYGVPRVMEDPADVHAMLERLVATHEASFTPRWSLDDQIPTFIDGMMRGIVAFEIPIARLEGKFKLSQDKRPEDRSGVISRLNATGRVDDADVAALMAEREDGLS